MIKLISRLLVGVLLAICFTGTVKAGVIIYFSEVEGNVFGTTSGSILVPADGLFEGGGELTMGDEFRLFNSIVQIQEWSGGNFYSSGLKTGPSAAYGDGFGYSYDDLLLPTAATGEFFPETTFEWAETNLEDIGLGYLTTTPFTVYELNGQTISFALAPTSVPEPASCAALVGLFVLSLGVLRRRR